MLRLHNIQQKVGESSKPGHTKEGQAGVCIPSSCLWSSWYEVLFGFPRCVSRLFFLRILAV